MARNGEVPYIVARYSMRAIQPVFAGRTSGELASKSLLQMAKTRFDPQEYLPLTPATFHVLLALADRDRHGYAIMQEVGVRTGGQLRIGAGTLYSLLKRLLREGLIDDLDERPVEGDERRRYYRLTPHGRAVARAEAIRLAAAARLATALRILSPEVAQ